ncbi:MAG: HTTM domain-containing protein [Bacteroidota bacterium]
MINKVINSITHAIDVNEKPRKLNSLALFRVLFFSHILFTIYFTQVYKGLIFDSIAGITKNPFPFNTFLGIWTLSALLMLIGMGSRVASIINYVCVVISYELFWRSGVLSYYDDLLLIGSFLCIFLPVSKTFSVDASLKRIVTGNTQPVFTSQLVYISFITLSLGLMYFGSGVTKLVSPIWQKGIGLWIPMSLPFFKWNAIPGHLADFEWPVKALNYITMAWETLFVAMLFLKRLRAVAIVMGIVFHIGIGLFFHFPMEAMGTLVFYALFVPDSWWDRLSARLETSAKIEVFIPENNMLAARAWAFLKSIDFRSRFVQTASPSHESITLATPAVFTRLLKTYIFFAPVAWFLQSGAYRGIQQLVKQALPSLGKVSSAQVLTYSFKRSLLIHFMLFLSLVQCYLSARHVVRKLVSKPSSHIAPVSYSQPPKTLNPSWLTRSLFGINGRGLFLDNALAITRTVYAVRYTDPETHSSVSFPYANEKGNVVNDMHVDGTASRPYAHYIQKGNSLSVEGLEKVVRYWLSKKHQKYTDIQFYILNRTYIPPARYEAGYWHKMEVLPWDTAGTARWQNDTFNYVPHIKAIFSEK